jgi:hypothetical protein
MKKVGHWRDVCGSMRERASSSLLAASGSVKLTELRFAEQLLGSGPVIVHISPKFCRDE